MNFELTIFVCVFAVITAYILPKKYVLKLWYFYPQTLYLSIIVSCIRIARVAFMPSSQYLGYTLLSQLITYGSLLWFFMSAFNILIFKRQIKYGIRPDYRRIINWCYKSAAIFNCALFIFYTVGKARHWQEMETFFSDSGYPRYFAYLTVSLECTMALVLLLPVRNSIHKYAAFILLLEMLGAVATHIRNGDPLIASHDALIQIILISILLFWCITAAGKFV